MPLIKFHSPNRQSGAVLYIALIMLVLLALIGIVGLQVTGLQEKMSSNYQSSNLAFQNAEAYARQTECGIEDLVNRTSTADCTAPTDVAVCDTPFDGPAWADNLQFSGGKQLNVRLIGPCISGNSELGMGEPVNEDPNPIYQVTAYNTDYGTNPTADAAIDTIFRP
ncbi:pilus assembly protein [Xanthomonas sp. AmX2]|uniref:pilus assembly PilX family protein n=1 Tax=Xanthomonas sp. TaxID=29446 RepID=UPI001981F9E7|nr:PilX N-terminal domain-containing pilus assembly protein [Xanthomonas sp.]MBN6151192.1 pilus assembly protein [Xanthomonas sp.]